MCSFVRAAAAARREKEQQTKPSKSREREQKRTRELRKLKKLWACSPLTLFFCLNPPFIFESDERQNGRDPPLRRRRPGGRVFAPLGVRERRLAPSVGSR